MEKEEIKTWRKFHVIIIGSIILAFFIATIMYLIPFEVVTSLMEFSILVKPFFEFLTNIYWFLLLGAFIIAISDVLIRLIMEKRKVRGDDN